MARLLWCVYVCVCVCGTVFRLECGHDSLSSSVDASFCYPVWLSVASLPLSLSLSLCVCCRRCLLLVGCQSSLASNHNNNKFDQGHALNFYRGWRHHTFAFGTTVHKTGTPTDSRSQPTEAATTHSRTKHTPQQNQREQEKDCNTA